MTQIKQFLFCGIAIFNISFAVFLTAALCGCGIVRDNTNDNAAEATDAEQDIRNLDDVTIAEVEDLYYNCGGGYGFNVAGYEFTFAEYIKYDPATIHYPFCKLRDLEEDPLRIVDSDDGRVRFYGWDTHMGGTCISWNTLYQISDKGKVYTYEGMPDSGVGEESMLVTGIYRLPHHHKKYYVICFYFREWSSLSMYSAYTYELKDRELKRIKLFKDFEGNSVDHIWYEYNSPDYYFRIARALDFDYHFYWDEKNNSLYYPLGRKNNGLIMSDRYVPYHWNGKTLEPQAETGNPHLCASLQNYACLVQAVSTHSYFIRIDSLDNGRLRYAAWNNGISDSPEPDMLLENGVNKDGRYYFRNETTTYAVTQEDWPVLEIYKNDPNGNLLNMFYKEESISADE